MRTLMTRALDRLREETGIAIVIALAVLLISIVLVGVASSIAINTNILSTHDTNTKAALEAADAGARAAVYRLNSDKPGSNSCPTTPATSVGSNGLCAQNGPETLGNGATFTYWISRAMQTGDTCVGPSVSSSTSDVSQRCITSLGTANGVSQRLQERVAAYTSTPVFPAAIFGTKSVTISNNVTIVSDTLNSPALLGTNGLLTIGGTGGGTTTIDGWGIPSSATVQKGNNVVDLGPESTVSQYPIATPINAGTTAQNTAGPPYDLSASY